MVLTDFPRQGPYAQFVLFGDSITEWSASQEQGFSFMAALQNAYIRRLDVINRGFSGYNTNMALRILPSFMPSRAQATIQFMTVFFGANDACLPSSSTRQHVPLEQYRANLKTILTHSSVKDHEPRLILITPPAVDEYQMDSTLQSRDCLKSGQPLKASLEVRRTAQNTKQYAEACKEVGEQCGVAVLDLWLSFMTEVGWEDGQPLPGCRTEPVCPSLQDLLSDGLHLSCRGYAVLYREMMRTVQTRWPEMAGEVSERNFPLWNQMAE